MGKFDFKKFVKERDEALLSLDEKKIKRYCKKWGVPIPTDETVFWAGVHKCIVNINSAPLEKKLQSAAWLNQHGFKTTIFGGTQPQREDV